MAESDLPKEVRDLVARHLHGMEEIEVLLLLAGESGGLTVSEIRDRLRLPVSGLPMTSLTRLTTSRLISSDGAADPRYAYSAATSMRRAVDLLRVAYNERPVTLVRLVYNRPSPAESFADAFRIKKEDES